MIPKTDFIYWGGADNPPVADDVNVVAVARSGHEYTERAGDVIWSHDAMSSDIIAYRVIYPELTHIAFAQSWLNDEGKKNAFALNIDDAALEFKTIYDSYKHGARLDVAYDRFIQDFKDAQYEIEGFLTINNELYAVVEGGELFKINIDLTVEHVTDFRNLIKKAG